MNYKSIGDIGQNVAIGELAKYQIGVAFPLSDNYPFDLIIIVGNKLFKAQVKSSSSGDDATIKFDFCTNNFYTGETKKYNNNDIDIIIGVDLRSFEVYLFDEFQNKFSITLRGKPCKNNQQISNLKSNYIISNERIDKLFGFSPEKLTGYFSKLSLKKYENTCLECSKTFANGYKNAKYCSQDCRCKARRKVIHPEKDVLQEDIKQLSWRALGMKYGVSDNAVKKWARGYNLL